MFVKVRWWNKKANAIGAIARLNPAVIGSMYDETPVETSEFPAHTKATWIRTIEPEYGNYYAPHSVEAVEQAVALLRSLAAQEETANPLDLPLTHTSEEPLRTWCLDLTDSKKIHLVQTEISADEIKLDGTTISIERPAAPATIRTKLAY